MGWGLALINLCRRADTIFECDQIIALGIGALLNMPLGHFLHADSVVRFTLLQ